MLGTYYTFDTDCHTYEIYWTNKNAYYIIDNDIVHTVTSSGTTAVDTPSLKIGLQNFNSGGNVDDNQFRVRSSTINRLGATATRPMWKYIAGAAGTVLKYGPGTLHKIMCNKNLGTSITLYDNVSGTTNPICAIDPTSRGELQYDLDFYNGLNVTTVGLVDVTIVYE